LEGRLARRKRKTLFGQSYYERSKLKVPDLKGSAYKFCIFIPIMEGDRWEIFSSGEIETLAKLLDGDFGGSTNTPVLEATQHPLLVGRYRAGKELITNSHVRFEVYARQSNVAIDYFRELKENLENYSRKAIVERVHTNGHITYTGEDQILIEYTLATIL
jgi:hypothetical protein